MIIRKATLSDVVPLIVLITEFRKFYKQESNPEKLQTFLEERIHKEDSEILVAVVENQLAGYAQLFPSFSTIKLNKIWILNDLFVLEAFRGKGIASLLIKTILKFSKATQRKQVWLLTGNDNKSAQQLYSKLGFNNTKFKHYVYNN